MSVSNACSGKTDGDSVLLLRHLRARRMAGEAAVVSSSGVPFRHAAYGVQRTSFPDFRKVTQHLGPTAVETAIETIEGWLYEGRKPSGPSLNHLSAEPRTTFSAELTM